MKLLSKAKSAVQSQLTPSRTKQAREFFSKTGTYIKENPEQAFQNACIGIVTVVIADTSGDVELMADATNVSAAIDVWEYSGS